MAGLYLTGRMRKLFCRVVYELFKVSPRAPNLKIGTQGQAASDLIRDWLESERKIDVAIIGAGAYGLPLAAYVKRMGKQALHLGGAT